MALHESYFKCIFSFGILSNDSSTRVYIINKQLKAYLTFFLLKRCTIKKFRDQWNKTTQFWPFKKIPW